MKNSKSILLAVAALAASVCVSQAQLPASSLLVRFPFTDTGAGTTCASDLTINPSAANLTLNTLNQSSVAANFHGTPGGGVSGLNIALDFSTNSDFSIAGGINVEGQGNGPVADNTGSTALNFGTVSTYTACIWFKANSLMNNGGNTGPRIFVLGAHGITDKASANSVGLYWQGANEIAATINATELNGPVNTGSFTVGQWYFYAVTYDGANATIYEGLDNGVGSSAVISPTAETGSMTLNNASGSVLMVGNRTAVTRPFDGWLNDFRFYNQAASAAQVEDIRWSSLAPIVTATPGNNAANLSFLNLAGATSYTVYRSTSPTGPFNTSPTGGTGVTSTSFTDSTAVNGTTYYYEVSAVDENGDNTTSQNSQPVTVTPQPPPTTPQFVTVTPGNGSVSLSWSTSTGAYPPISYNLAKSTTSGSEVLLLNTTATTYTDTAVANGIEYFYTVTAVNAQAEASATSVESNATPIGPPAVPANIYADVVSGGVLVNWTPVPGATFDVYRATSSGGPYTEITSGVSTTNYLDAAGVLGDYYEVVSVGAGGSSPNSSPVESKPLLLNVNFDSGGSGGNFGGGEVPVPTAASGAAAIGSPGDIWNGVNGGGATTVFASGPLVNSDGSPSAVTLSVLAPSGAYCDNAPAFTSFSPFAWASVADMNADIGYPNSPFAVLMSTLLDANTATANGYVSLGGLTPNTAYTLFVYSAGNLAGRTSTFSVTQGTGTSPGPQEGANQSCTYDDKTITMVNGVDYLVFSVLSDSNGDLTINWGNLGVNENDFCGFQLIEETVTAASLTTSSALNGQTLCTNTSVTFTAASGTVGGTPNTTITSFTNVVATSALGSAVVTSTTNVYTANGSFSGTVIAGLATANATLTMPLTTNLKYSINVTAVPATGAPLLAGFTFDTFAPALVIESADYNFSGGSWLDTPANGGVWLYANVNDDAGVDFFKNAGGIDNATLFYRDVGATAGFPFVTENNADTFTEQKNVVATTGATIGVNDFPELGIGYATPGDWQNYTRTFGSGPYLTGNNFAAGGSGSDSAPAGTYNVWLYMAEGGSGGPQAAFNSVNPSPPTTTSQTVTQLGQFGTSTFAESDWNGFEYVPMTDSYGNLLAITVPSGVNTFQIEQGPVPNPNLGFVMLMPAVPVLTPGLSYLYPDGLHPFEPTNVFAFTVTPNNGSSVANSGIYLVLNGSNVTSGLSITAAVGGTWKVSYPILYNDLYSAVISITNTTGVYNIFPINFDTFGTNFYQWECVDYDFSTNNGFQATPPKQGNESLSGWISAQFIDNPVPTADTTSSTGSGFLGETVTNSYANQPMGFLAANDSLAGAGAVAEQGVDINVVGAGQGAGQQLYRVGEAVADGTGVAVGNQVTSDYIRPKFVAARAEFSDPNIGPYNVGYIAAGDWFNYTRHYPAGYYNVWARLAFDAPYSLSLGQVTAGVGTGAQTVTPLGTFTSATGPGYQAWQWIPLLNASGNPVTLALTGAATTFQAQAGTGINMEFFMLVPGPFPLTAAYVGGQLQISFPTELGYKYQIQYTSTLTPTTWSNVGSPVTGTGGVVTVNETSPGYYQGVAIPLVAP